MRLPTVVQIVVAMAWWIAPRAEARAVQILSYQESLDKSDLVVIATPVTKTADTKEQYIPLNIIMTDGKGHILSQKWIGVETVFKVAAVLKGDAKTREFILHHYREAPQPFSDGTANRPALVWFDPSGNAKASAYLLFLVREQDGRYAPTGGQTDPGRNTVIKLPYDYGARLR
jgi:hypothetical protein